MNELGGILSLSGLSYDPQLLLQASTLLASSASYVDGKISLGSFTHWLNRTNTDYFLVPRFDCSIFCNYFNLLVLLVNVFIAWGIANLHLPLGLLYLVILVSRYLLKPLARLVPWGRGSRSARESHSKKFDAVAQDRLARKLLTTRRQLLVKTKSLKPALKFSKT